VRMVMVGSSSLELFTPKSEEEESEEESNSSGFPAN
jgi:hypothetical protein